MNFYTYGDEKLGYGKFELPPLLIGTIFYQGETILTREDETEFNEEKAKSRIEKHKSLAKKYKLPEMIEISATSPEAMLRYLEFYLSHFEPPFVLGGTLDARMAGVVYLSEQGIEPSEYVYNAVSNLKNQKEMALLEKHQMESVVVLMNAPENATSNQRFSYITEKSQPGNENIVDGLKKRGAKRIWIDGATISLESLAHIIEAQQLICESLQLPVGTAPNNFLFKYASPRLNQKFHTRFRRASIMHIVSWFSNFLFYGAIEDAKESFSSVSQAMQFKNIVKENRIKLLEKF